MRWLLALCLLSLAGCAQDDVDAQPEPAPCPGHFHVTLLVADGDEVLPYFDSDDVDASGPVQGIHMHGDDGLIHIHPPTQTCLTLAATLFAVDVHVLQRDGGGLQVGDDVRNGTLRLDVQPWGEDWQTWDVTRLQDTVPDAARVLLMVDAPADVSDLRAQVPPIPATYQPR